MGATTDSAHRRLWSSVEGSRGCGLRTHIFAEGGSIGCSYDVRWCLQTARTVDREEHRFSPETDARRDVSL